MPELTPYLRLFAIDLVLVNVARAYREVLTGTGRFREVALMSAVRWTARLVFLAALVSMTLLVTFAVIGSLGATLAELATARHFQHIPLRGRGGVTARAMWSVAAPLFIYGAASQLFTKVDSFALSALGGTTAEGQATTRRRRIWQSRQACSLSRSRRCSSQRSAASDETASTRRPGSSAVRRCARPSRCFPSPRSWAAHRTRLCE